MTRTELGVLRMIVRKERDPNYVKALGVTVSTPTGVSLRDQKLITTRRFGKRAMRAWSTDAGRLHVDLWQKSQEGKDDE